MRYKRAALILFLIVLARMGHAQGTLVSDREMIQQLAQQIKTLQEKVVTLESQPRPATPTGEDITPQPANTSTMQAADDPAPPASLLQEIHELRGIQWRGFGEVDYKVLDQRIPELETYGFVGGSHGNFYTGDFDLLLTSRLTDKASVLAEIAFGEEAGQNYTVDLERALLKYDYNDHLRMSFGRYHTGIGYYNVAFHSGSWLQTTADRPLIMEFTNHGGVLPTQAVGLSFTGSIPSGRLGLNYIAEYGSSDTERPDLDTGRVYDENNSNHINVGLFARPLSLPGLQIGGSYYHDLISDNIDVPTVRVRQTIVNGHVVYLRHGIEFLGEGFLIRHDYGSLLVHNMPAFYAQVSKEFRHVRPFFRYQYINANPDGVLADVALRRGPSFGARYDFNDYIAFKAQLDHTLRKGRPDLNGLHLQLAFTF
jgi:hypothetical protein